MCLCFDTIHYGNYFNTNFLLFHIVKRYSLTKEQRDLLRFLRTENKQTPKQIRKHPKMIKPNGELYQLQVIKNWVDRVDTCGHVDNLLKNTGRKRLFNKYQEGKLVKLMRKNCRRKGPYRYITRKRGLRCTPRCLNNYGLRNGIRKWID